MQIGVMTVCNPNELMTMCNPNERANLCFQTMKASISTPPILTLLVAVSTAMEWNMHAGISWIVQISIKSMQMLVALC